MIIGLSGPARSGKNTAAKFIAEEFGDNFFVNEWSFAYDLKVSAAESLGETEDHVEFCDALKTQGTIRVYLDDHKVIEISGRQYLQFYGTEGHRKVFKEDFWVDNLLDKIKANAHPGSATEERLDIVTDARFDNEAIGIRETPLGKIVNIKRPDVEVGDKHASEAGISPEYIDATVVNDGSLENFKNEVIWAVERYVL